MRDFFKFPGLTPSLPHIVRMQYLLVENNLVGTCGEEGHTMPATLSLEVLFLGLIRWVNGEELGLCPFADSANGRGRGLKPKIA